MLNNNDLTLISSLVICIVASIVLILALFQSFRFWLTHRSTYKMIIHIFIVLIMAGCILQSMQMASFLYLPPWIFFTLQEEMFATSLPIYAILDLIWARSYYKMTKSTDTDELKVIYTRYFTFTAFFLPFLYVISCGIVFYFYVEDFEQGWALLHSYFVYLHLVSYIGACIFLFYFCGKIIHLALSLKTRGYSRRKSIQLAATLGIIFILRVVLCVSFERSDLVQPFYSIYLNSWLGILVYFLVQHIVLPICFLVILRKTPSEHRSPMVGSKIYDKLLSSTIDASSSSINNDNAKPTIYDYEPKPSVSSVWSQDEDVQ